MIDTFYSEKAILKEKNRILRLMVPLIRHCLNKNMACAIIHLNELHFTNQVPFAALLKFSEVVVYKETAYEKEYQGGTKQR